ncbi:hypothetical protein [Marimonas lutisalis]|uniref:hypothetical protein n=1 Tax=Marimonas lutisalis TaxID=2545756 RepID=UPI0010F5DDC1|nr:hypothetical protein [Marimonas lutisalis]
MHTETNTARRAPNTPIWLRALNWLADRNAAYRASHKLRNMPDERLDDMGITRDEANAAFYHRGSRKADRGVSAKLVAFRLP